MFGTSIPCITKGTVMAQCKRNIVKYLLTSGIITLSVGLLLFCVQVVFAQSRNTSLAPEVGFITDTTSDPWFWAFVGGWIFSCLVSGMPEPEKTNSPFYIWAYRSFHIIAGMGTRYFQHKMYWSDDKGE
jgi:hypothetical protein